MAKSRNESVAINTGANIAMTLTSQLMLIILNTVFAKVFTRDLQGLNSTFSSLMSTLALADLGIASAIAFALYGPLRENNQQKIAALMNFYKKAYRVVALTITLLGLAMLPFLRFIATADDAAKLGLNIPLIFMLFVINSASSYLLVFKSTLLTASQKRYMISRISIGFAIGRAVVQSVLLLVFHSYILFLVVGIAENLLRNYMVSRTADKAYPSLREHSDARLDKGEVKSLFKDVYALSLYKMSGVLMRSVDNVIIKWITSAGFSRIANLSWYRVIIDMVDNLVNQFFNGLLPSLGNLASEADGERQLRVFHTLMFITFWCTCFCATSFLVLINPFLTIWLGSSYLEPLTILLALLIDYYIAAMLRPVNTYRNANGLFVQGKYRPLAMAIIKAGLSIAVAQRLGMIGVLLASTASRLLTAFWYEPMLVYRNVFHVSQKDYWKRYLSYFAVALICAALSYGISLALVTDYHVLNFLIKMALCVVVPNAIIIALFRKTPEFREFMDRLMALVAKAKMTIQRKRKGASA